MNKRKMSGRFDNGTNYIGFIICGALFICGGAVGIAAAGYAGQNGSLSEYLSRYVRLVSESQSESIMVSLFNACKYHLISVFFGFSLLGVVLVPALSMLRGFFLCFSASVIVRIFGRDGAYLALSVFGVSTVITIPVFFVVSVMSFSSSVGALRTVLGSGGGISERPYRDGYMRSLAICFAVLVISAIFDVVLVRNLIGHVAKRLL